MNIRVSVRVWNAKLGTTNKELAEHLGVTQSWLSQILTTNQSSRIQEMADFYHIPVSAFIAEGERCE